MQQAQSHSAQEATPCVLNRTGLRTGRVVIGERAGNLPRGPWTAPRFRNLSLCLFGPMTPAIAELTAAQRLRRRDLLQRDVLPYVQGRRGIQERRFIRPR